MNIYENLNPKQYEGKIMCRVSIVIEKDNEGYFVYSPELPGCFSQGDTYENAIESIKEAVELYIETLTPEEREEIGSKQISTSSIEVAMA